MFCTNCGNQIDTASPFCRYCGIPVAPVYPIAKKKNNTAVIVAVCLAVVLVAGATVWFVTSRKGDDRVFAAGEDAVVDTDMGTASVTDVIGGSYTTDDQQEPSGNGAIVDGGQVQTGGNSGGIDYATSERPDMSHFLWYTEGVYYDGLPYEAVSITEFSDLTGSWKAYLMYDPDNIANAYGFEYLNIVVDGDMDNVSLIFDWYKMYAGEAFEEYDLSDLEDTVLFGNHSQGSIAAGEPGYMIYITDFYMLYGKQYAVGYMELESGEATYVAMVRP